MRVVGPCTKNREKHHWHDSDRQPMHVKTIKYQVCCHCSQSREVRGTPTRGKDCGNYEVDPKVVWDYKASDDREEKREKPKAEKDETKKLTPPDNAVPGDYIVTLRGRSADASSTVNLRVTVEQSTIWGWLGIVLVLVVLGSLGGLFWRLGRR